MILKVLWTVWIVFYSIFEVLFRMLIPKKRKDVSARTVLITGGANGLGKHLAILFAEKGSRVIIWDIDGESAERAVALLRSMGMDAYAYLCDCSSEKNVKLVAAQVKREIGPVDILINNAGILNGRDILTLTDSEIRKCIEINILAQFWTVRAFLPEMMQNNEGHIVSIGSMAGHHGSPYLTDYCASKFAVLGLHDSLFLELRELGYSGIKLSCISPHFFNSGMSWFPKSNIPSLTPVLSTEEVALRVVDAVEVDDDIVFIPDIFRFFLHLRRILPRRAGLAFYDLLGVGIEPHCNGKRN